MSHQVNTTLIENCISLAEYLNNPIYMNEVVDLISENDLGQLSEVEKIMVDLIRKIEE
jgi:hypothetical protein